MARSIKVRIENIVPSISVPGALNSNPDPSFPLAANLSVQTTAQPVGVPAMNTLPLPIAVSDIANFIPGTFKYLVVSDTDPNGTPTPPTS